MPKKKNNNYGLCIYNENEQKHYNKYHNTAYSYNKNGFRMKNFNDGVMKEISFRLKELQNSGVKIKTYQYIRLCHEAIATFNNYDPGKHSIKMLDIASENARNYYSIIN